MQNGGHFIQASICMLPFVTMILVWEQMTHELEYAGQ